MAIDPKTLKLSKRRLRFEKCKSVTKLQALKNMAGPSSSASKPTKDKSSSSKPAYNAQAAPARTRKPLPVRKSASYAEKTALAKKLENLPKVCIVVSSVLPVLIGLDF